MEFDKEIKINENRTLRFSMSDNRPYIHTIEEGFIENNRFMKRYRLARWDDYGFSSCSADEEKEEELYEFDINHPLYIPLLHLINYDEELVIDDDQAYDDYKKYISIFKKEDKIYLRFIDLYEDYGFDKFSVFIKNTGFDLRSKIDSEGKDTKERLYYFFKEVREWFTEDYHQITLEEYNLENYPDNIEELKKYVKRKDDIFTRKTTF